jgi:apolipoprotein N-acyltransferase
MLLALGAVACFHGAYALANPNLLAWLVVGYVLCLVQLARMPTTRQAFYWGLLTAFACVAPQLGFMWTIFSVAAIPLWLILSFWIAAFVALSHVAWVRFGGKWAAWLMPFLWTGLEYFRSELYYLKFAWLNVGYAFAGHACIPFHLFGVYGVGFVVVAFACLFVEKHSKLFWANTASVILALLGLGLFLPLLYVVKSPQPPLHVAGVQLEFPVPAVILHSLNQVMAAHPEVDLIVLSEYSLDGEPTPGLKNWCRKNGKYLIVGGKDPAPGNNFYNAAFVISPNGEVVFQQAKRVPIQFFKDGLPAPGQRVWNSPWGKIGLCICYDLSYTRVTDELARQGAQMLIVPTMDVADWGRHQHELHARIAPVRAGEYGIPIFRLASSGISQGVMPLGITKSIAPCFADGGIITFDVQVVRPASLPLDRWLAPLCVAITGVLVLWLAVENLGRKFWTAKSNGAKTTGLG